MVTQTESQALDPQAVLKAAAVRKGYIVKFFKACPGSGRFPGGLDGWWCFKPGMDTSLMTGRPTWGRYHTEAEAYQDLSGLLGLSTPAAPLAVLPFGVLPTEYWVARETLEVEIIDPKTDLIHKGSAPWDGDPATRAAALTLALWRAALCCEEWAGESEDEGEGKG